MNRLLLVMLILVSFNTFSYGQGYLHVSGKKIVNGNNEEVILRGIGTGNWFIQEGYMMKSSDFAGTQREFRNKLIQTIGTVRCDAFYKAWLDNHFTKADADSMKRWGFNSVRVALHYKWLTLPIEEEPVAGQDTWLEEGFQRLDNLLSWCADNRMYLILDLHGAPGGQGKDANISDYDPSKPSLWESSENRRKTVALWARLAQRYSTSPWIGGYDLINEPNWTLPGGTLLRQLYGDITTAIRAHDKNHMLIIEGNWFANDYTGLTPPWDNNMIYSGHKYWTYNNDGDIDYMLKMRDTWNVPVWLGESGENSNSWFSSAIALCEKNGVGWSWWPVKKAGINNVLMVPESKKYNDLISFWKTGSPVVTPDQAYAAVMEWAENHKIRNCIVQRDVIDAMIRQPFTTSTLPFILNKPGRAIAAVNWDLGQSGYAYHDTDSANYHLNTNVRVDWNRGWAYRNDGVDIERCTDNFPGGVGYHVGWTEAGEWMNYTIDADSAAAYTLAVRTASGSSQPGVVRFMISNTDICAPVALPATGSWDSWSTTTAANVILPKGRSTIKLLIEQGGSNINLFNFINPVAITSLPLSYFSSEVAPSGKEIIVTLSKEITTMTNNPSDIQIVSNGNFLSVSSLSLLPGDNRKFIVTLSQPVSFTDKITISYYAGSIRSGNLILQPFASKEVYNKLPPRFILPMKIEAENFSFNKGFQMEDCKDNGGGKNSSYANDGDYLDYFLQVPQSGEYLFHFRVASQYGNAKLAVQTGSGDTFQTISTLNIPATGGWQTYTTPTLRIRLTAGNTTLRLLSITGEYNLNWFEIAGPTGTTGVDDPTGNTGLKIYPNPGKGLLKFEIPCSMGQDIVLNINSMTGQRVYSHGYQWSCAEINEINLNNIKPGLYMVECISKTGRCTSKLLIN